MKKLLHERLREVVVFDNIKLNNTWLCINEKIACELADEIERYYVPRPRFEDGEPVQFGDDYECEDGLIHKVISLGIGQSGSLYVNPDTMFEVRIGVGEYIKRPTPKVLDADGVEIKEGDTAWATIAGRVERCTVQGFTKSGCIDVLFESNSMTTTISPKCLTHKEPDSLEKLRDDITELWERLDNNETRAAIEGFADRLSALIEREE